MRMKDKEFGKRKFEQRDIAGNTGKHGGKMDKIKSKNKKLKVWFGRFPAEAQPMDMCIKIDCGSSDIDDQKSMYYMIYIYTPLDNTISERFVYLYRMDDRKTIQEHLGVRFPKGF